MQTQAAEILSVGSLAFDSLRSPAGQVDKTLGGSGNFFSLAGAHFATIRLVGIVGEDFPKDHLSLLAKRGIDVSGIQIVPGGKTFHWAGEYDQNLNEAKTLSTSLNVFEHFSPQLTAVQAACPVVFLANIDPAIQASLLNQAVSARFIACDTMNFWISGRLDELKQVLKRVDLLSINEGEAFLLAQTRVLREAARRIQGLGPKILIIKRGEYGSTLFMGDRVFLCPAYPVDTVVDPTGAGDSFAGACLGFLAEAQVNREMIHKDPVRLFGLLKRAVIAGCAMASFTVEDFGLKRLQAVKKDELVARQKALVDLITL